MHSVVGIKARAAIVDFAQTCEERRLPHNPPLMFYVTLESIDPHGVVMSSSMRALALEATLELLGDPPDEHRDFQSMFQEVINRVTLDLSDFVKPIDLLEAAIRKSPAPIDAGLRAVGLSSEDVLQAVRRLPPENLSDEAL